RRGAGGGCSSADQHAIRGHQPAHRLPCRHQGLYRRGTGRHRQHSRRHARRPGTGRGRSLRRRYLRRPVQGRGGLHPADPGVAVPPHRHPRAPGGGKGMTRNLRTAFFSALLVIAVAVPVFGLKLTTVGINIQVHGADASTFWVIAACAVAMFVWPLFRSLLAACWAASPSLPNVPAVAGNFLTLPSAPTLRLSGSSPPAPWPCSSGNCFARAWPPAGRPAQACPPCLPAPATS